MPPVVQTQGHLRELATYADEVFYVPGPTRTETRRFHWAIDLSNLLRRKPLILMTMPAIIAIPIKNQAQVNEEKESRSISRSLERARTNLYLDSKTSKY